MIIAPVIAWERIIREQEKAAPSTECVAALQRYQAFFKHLVRHGVATRNPVVDVQRPTINREEGSTAAFSKAQARKLLDAPSADTLAGLRDRAILSVGLQVGLRRAEIAALTVGDLHQNRGLDALRVVRKGRPARGAGHPPAGGQRVSAPIWNLPVIIQIMTGRCFGPCVVTLRRMTHEARSRRTPLTRWCGNTSPRSASRADISAHSMRATFITTALENGAQLEDVQKAAGHRDPSTTKLYDRRGYNPEKAASFFATY